MKVTTTRSGIDVTAAMTRAAAAAPRIADEVADQAVDLIAERARRLVPSRTGRARASVHADTSGARARVVGGGARVPWFGWLDYGGLLRQQNISRTYRPGGRYIYPAAGEVWPKVLDALNDGATDILRAGGLR